MACGCIPVVTNIPSFKAITGNGEFGVLFQPGNVEDLLKKLVSLNGIEQRKMSFAVREHFKKELSFAAIAEKVKIICEKSVLK
jgi:glycosyltransferase involved in cell wall biosynthesis